MSGDDLGKLLQFTPPSLRATGKCACGEPAYGGNVQCPACAEHAEHEAEARNRARRAKPARFAWAHFDAPELGSRVRDHAAIAKMRGVAKEFDRVVLVGPSGAGKTTLAACVAHARAFAGASVAFVSAYDLGIARVQARFGEEPQSVADALRASVLVLDDVGSEPVNSQSAVPHVVHARHEAMRPTIVTTFLDVDGMKGRYSDAFARRVFEGAVVVEVGKGARR